MKKWFWRLVLLVSVALNLYLAGKYLFFDLLYTPNDEEAVILGEMVQKTVESEDYEKLRANERVVSITTSVDKNKGGVYPFYMEVVVKTKKQSYIFSCKDNTCAEMGIGGWMYSQYSKEEPKLPLHVKDN